MVPLCELWLDKNVVGVKVQQLALMLDKGKVNLRVQRWGLVMASCVMEILMKA